VNAQTKKDIKPTVKELPSLEKVLEYAEQNSHLVKEQNTLTLRTVGKSSSKTLDG
jgi:hypothetical protein